MNKEFIPYEQALDLKELGFDEPCFGWYSKDGTFYEGKMTLFIKVYYVHQPSHKYLDGLERNILT
jgi:hypothetical protein